MRQLLAVPAPNEGASHDRCMDIGALLGRLLAVQGDPPAAPPAQRCAEGLVTLSERGALTFESGAAVTLWYIPTAEALTSVRQRAGTWPEAAHKKQMEAYRQSTGALFSFPVEGRDEVLQVFITDWSPCPVAAAIAIHRYHPLAAGMAAATPPFFTGRYARHPLTGDLLPIWVGGWVKPDFGTGAVLVNPAHDGTDLAFGRAVGLPIRFGLVPDTFDGSPETWPAPPIIKMGRTTKTGFFDGLSVAEAMERYFETIATRGLAERHQDLKAGSIQIGVLQSDQGGDLCWCPGCGRIALAAEAAEPCPVCGGHPALMRAEPSPLFETALAIRADHELTLVCPSALQKEGLLFLRLLSHDLFGLRLEPAALYVVNKVQGSASGMTPEEARIGAVIGAPTSQTVALKQQIFDQVRRLLETHRELLESGSGDVDESAAAGSLWKAARNVKNALIDLNPAAGFAALYPLQKQLRAIGVEQRAHEGALAAYFTVTHILLGLPYPANLDLAQIWAAL